MNYRSPSLGASAGNGWFLSINVEIKRKRKRQENIKLNKVQGVKE